MSPRDRDPVAHRELLRASVLTEGERAQFFRTHGYLAIPDALSREETARLCSAVDRHGAAGPKTGQLSLNVADILGRDSAFLDLVDHPRVFPKLWGLLGWNLWVQHSHFVVTPPQPTPPPPAAPFSWGWHRDGGAIHRDVALDALLLVKVGFYLNDVTLDGGPTYFLEGADPRAPIPAATSLPANARPLAVTAGTAVLFGNRAIHSLRSPNTSAQTRRAVFLQYGYRWIQPLDRSTPPPEAPLDPIRRQLLGLTTTFTDERYKGSEGRSGRFVPSAHDVPLFAFLQELLGDEAPRYVARSLDDAELRS